MNRNDFVVKTSENRTIIPYIQYVEPFVIKSKGEQKNDTNGRNNESKKSANE